MATMALDCGNPRALLNLSGGVVGHVKSLVPEALSSECNSVSDGVTVGEVISDRKKRKKSIACFSLPSKPQMARTLSKCLPKQDVEEFERLFNSFQGETSCPPGCDNQGVDVNALIIKTRVVSILWALQRLYGIGNVFCEMCEVMSGERVDGKVHKKRDYLEIIAMDAVLARTQSPPKAVTGTETIDTPVRFICPRKETLDPEFDPMFRAFVVVVPDGATYYCHRERRRACIGVVNSHIPMDTSWLRVKRNGNSGDVFARGSYISRLWEGQPFWKFKICRGKSNFELRPIPEKPIDRLFWDDKLPSLKVMSVYQAADQVGPALPPDVIDGKQLEGWPSLRRAYRAAIANSRSSRRGCRHYAPSHLHRSIDPKKTLVIDPMEGDLDLRIAIQVKRAGDDGKVDSGKGNPAKQSRLALSRESVVQIRYLLNLGIGAEKLVSDIWQHASTATRGNHQSARKGLGDCGSMHPLGTRIMKDNKTRKRYKTSRLMCEQKALRKAVVASARLAAVTIPGILRIIQDAEEDGDIDPPEGGMNGDGGSLRVSFTMDVSVDLANASHFDVNDASQGFSIWTEDEPGGTKEWYFVLPNVYGRRPLNQDGTPGDVFHGVAIKLAHGVLISWDGRVIRHCTSMMDRPDVTKHVYGSFFAAKSSVVAYGARMAFVRESLRRHSEKLDRKRRRQKCAGAETVGKVMVARDEGEGDCGQVRSLAFASEILGPHLMDSLSTPIPRKSKVNTAATGDGLDEMSVSGEESWSDYTFASRDNGFSGVEDNGVISETNPLVEYFENELAVNGAEDVGGVESDLECVARFAEGRRACGATTVPENDYCRRGARRRPNEYESSDVSAGFAGNAGFNDRDGGYFERDFGMQRIRKVNQSGEIARVRESYCGHENKSCGDGRVNDFVFEDRITYPDPPIRETSLWQGDRKRFHCELLDNVGFDSTQWCANGRNDYLPGWNRRENNSSLGFHRGNNVFGPHDDPRHDKQAGEFFCRHSWEGNMRTHGDHQRRSIDGERWGHHSGDGRFRGNDVSEVRSYRRHTNERESRGRGLHWGTNNGMELSGGAGQQTLNLGQRPICQYLGTERWELEKGAQREK